MRLASVAKLAVVGHVEWVQFARVAHVARAGEVAHAHDPFEEPAGGGAVAAVQLARLGGACALITALGEDDHGRRAKERLLELGVEVRAVARTRPTRRAVAFTDDDGERAITTLGERLEPLGHDRACGWEELGGTDAAYFTAGDEPALRATRAAARVLVASPRAVHALGHGVPLDALVLSANDEIEREAAGRAEREAELVVLTEGAEGGRWRARGGQTGRWQAVAPPAPPVDSYGCGDSFAAGLAYGLGSGLELGQALVLAARCGATCLAGSGPYGRQLTASEL